MPVTAATCLITWSHDRRVRIEAAYASLTGVNAIPASSGNFQKSPSHPCRPQTIKQNWTTTVIWDDVLLGPGLCYPTVNSGCGSPPQGEQMN
ncbi:transposase [Pseudarthrobacter phenanthrenivorans]|uniref:transposase n=1 Tax=Pseudarthrobacter phenanthrenivorans TaxID=361575 RepID=UPI0011D249B4